MILKKFDIFPKYNDPDIRLKTTTGAILSICTISAMVVLFFHEFFRFVKPRIFEEVVVDTSRVGLQRTMPINFNISINMPCAKIHVDAYDFEGNQQADTKHDLRQVRVDENGYGIEDKKWLSVKKKEKKGREKKAIEKQRSKDYCGSCYGAGAKGQCCNSCDDVIDAFKAKGWSINGIDRWQQCIEEGYANLGNESCLTFGVIRVQRVSGTLYFALGDVKPGEKKMHDISRISKSINFSHRIFYLEFGPKIPGSINPLDDVQVNQENQGHMVYSYNLNVVPTKWISRRNFVVNTYKFQPMISQKNLTEKVVRGMPGIYINYNIAPISVVSKESAYSLWKFITSVCAIIGGCFTCASFADQFLFATLSTIEGKRKIGKDI